MKYGSMHPLPNTPSWRSDWLVKHRNNFTFSYLRLPPKPMWTAGMLWIQLGDADFRFLKFAAKWDIHSVKYERHIFIEFCHNLNVAIYIRKTALVLTMYQKVVRLFLPSRYIIKQYRRSISSLFMPYFVLLVFHVPILFFISYYFSFFYSSSCSLNYLLCLVCSDLIESMAHSVLFSLSSSDPVCLKLKI
jgi:hypothetical protein